jgi:hypothetical protein
MVTQGVIRVPVRLGGVVLNGTAFREKLHVAPRQIARKNSASHKAELTPKRDKFVRHSEQSAKFVEWSQKKEAPKTMRASFFVVPMTGIELVTYALRVRCSTN